MKSLTQTITLSLFTLLLSPLAQAFVGNSPQLNCHDTAMSIPERKVTVQVYGQSDQNPAVRVRVLQMDMNFGDTVLFDGNVSETNEVRAKLLSAVGLEMKLAENSSGQIEGVVAVQNENEAPRVYNVNCEVFFQLMSSKPAPPTDQI